MSSIEINVLQVLQFELVVDYEEKWYAPCLCYYCLALGCVVSAADAFDLGGGSIYHRSLVIQDFS